MLKDAVRNRTNELKNALTKIEFLNKEILLRLTTAAEFRDSETGAHISRIGLYSNKIAEALDMPMSFIETISSASLLHDIGKIGIPDDLLLKPGPLTDEETEIMNFHTTIGGSILSNSSHPLIKMAESIAINHHERWNGTGYPKGIKSKAIPIEGSIVNICDQYDALMNERPYKPSLNHRETFRIITEGDGRTMPDHFDPRVLNAFRDVSGVFEEIYHSNRD
jgi:putative two-component system response regulator